MHENSDIKPSLSRLFCTQRRLHRCSKCFHENS